MGATTPRHSSTYRVDDPRKLGEILWESIPPRVSVSIESQITIHPDSAEWVAVLRYDVIGGALDAIYLKMPAAWSAGAALHLPSGEYQLTTETRGADAFWTITPERPIWGSQRFVLRSSRHLESDRPIVHPEITPRGKGVVDAYLSIINATGQPLATANAVGLQSIPYASKFQAREFATFGGTAVGAFRVVKDSWTVSVELPKIASRDMDSVERFGPSRLCRNDDGCHAGSVEPRQGRLRHGSWYRPEPVVRAPTRQHSPLGNGRLQSGRSTPLIIRDLVYSLRQSRANRASA